mgnify:CR=1 FL=1
MWELSTPFVYVRWVLLKLGLADSRLFFVNNLVGFLVFISCRNIYGPCKCDGASAGGSAHDIQCLSPGDLRSLSSWCGLFSRVSRRGQAPRACL